MTPLPLRSFRRLLPRPGEILPAAVPHGIREGRLWLRGVRVQRPRAQVPTPDLQQDLPLRIRVSTAGKRRVQPRAFIIRVSSKRGHAATRTNLYTACMGQRARADQFHNPQKFLSWT